MVLLCSQMGTAVAQSATRECTCSFNRYWMVQRTRQRGHATLGSKYYVLLILIHLRLGLLRRRYPHPILRAPHAEAAVLLLLPRLLLWHHLLQRIGVCEDHARGGGWDNVHDMELGTFLMTSGVQGSGLE